MALRFFTIFCFFLAPFILAGCQTTGSTGEGTSVATSSGGASKASYNFFFDQGDHLDELIAAGNFSDAARLYSEQKAFFTNPEQAPEAKPKLQKVADEMNSLMVPPIKDALKSVTEIAWPAPPGEWANLRGGFARARNSLRAYNEIGMLSEAPYRAPEVDQLAKVVADKADAIHQSAKDQFAAYDHLSGHSFFSRYPMELDGSDFFAKNPGALNKVLKGASSAQFSAFAKTYSQSDLGSDAWTQFSDAFITTKTSDLKKSGRDPLASTLGSIRLAKKHGLNPSKKKSLKIAFVEVTSRTLLKEGAIDFPASVDTDLPIEAVKANLDQVLTGKAAVQSDYVIIFDVALATARRRITGIDKKSSRLIAGYRTEPNPERARVQTELSQAQMEFNNANINYAAASNRYCYGLGCLGQAIGNLPLAAARRSAQEKVQQLMQNLNSLPLTVEIPIFQNYKFDVAKVRAKKTMTVHYYVIDKRRKAYFKSTFDVVENETFNVAYKVQEEDPDRDRHISAHASETDVLDWEKKDSSVKLSQLIDHFLANQSDLKPLPSPTEMRQAMLRDKNLALKKYKEQTFEGSTQSDPRFDSVVVVYNPEGSLGSGFFVRPDIVMTNYHVVEEQNFVEMRLYDKQETFGKVIARDAGLDLALVKVQTRGKPVEFYHSNKIDLGSTVEAIGHPRGYEFSITRGVVSSVRRGGTAVMNSGKGVLQLQIDASVSPGNSGGPVFLKDKVVGIVSWGRVDQGSQNLNFIIHYSEAKEFLRRELAGRS